MDNLDFDDANSLRSVAFGSSRKGYDKAEVAAFINRVASHIENQQRSLSAVEARLAGLEAELARAQIEAVRELDQEELTELLGAEAAKVLQAAHDAEADRLARAEADAAALLARVETDVLSKLEAAEEDAARVVERAREESERLRADGLGAADEERRKAEQHIAESQEATTLARKRAAAEAADEIDAAKDEGRELVLEAQVVRERMLKDLARRRQSGRRELEQIRAGRDRLLSAFEAAARTLDEILEELTVSLPEARVAAELAGRATEDELTVEQLEHELAAARHAGLPLVDTSTAELDPGNRSDALEASETAEVAAKAEVPEPAAPTKADDQSEAAPVAADTKPTVVLSELGGNRRGIFAKRPREAEGLPTEEVPVLRLPDNVEEVRVVTAAAAGANPGADEPNDHPVAQAVEPERAAETTTEVEVEDGAAVADDSAPEDVDGTEVEPVDAQDEVADDGAVEASLADHTTDAPGDEVGALFAKMRALREDPDSAVAADGPASAATEVTPEPEATPEPETVAESDDAAPPAPVSEPAFDDHDIIDRRDEVLAPHVGAIATALKRALADDQNELFDVLRRAKTKASIDDLVSLEEHALLYVRAAGPTLSAASIAGATFVDGPAGAVDLSAPAEIIANELVTTLRAEVESVLNDDAIVDPTNAIRTIARDIRNNRVAVVAADAALAAFNVGAFDAVADGSSLRWVNDINHACGPGCADNARSASTTKGLPFPSGQLHPPGVPGCRCIVAAVSRA